MFCQHMRTSRDWASADIRYQGSAAEFEDVGREMARMGPSLLRAAVDERSQSSSEGCGEIVKNDAGGTRFRFKVSCQAATARDWWTSTRNSFCTVLTDWLEGHSEGGKVKPERQCPLELGCWIIRKFGENAGPCLYLPTTAT